MTEYIKSFIIFPLFYSLLRVLARLPGRREYPYKVYTL